jgi:hypothetical protein
MPLDYFGQQANDSNDNSGTNYELAWYNTKTFACPGSGSKTVEELSLNCWVISGTPKIRVGIWTTGGTLIAESNEITVTGGSPAWQGGLSAAQIRPAGGSLGDPVTLTGGNSYLLGFAETNAGDLGIRDQSGGSSGDVRYTWAIDYTTGLPAVSTGTDWSGWWNVRCGVTQVEAATLDQEGFRFRNDDGDEDAASFAAGQDTNLTAPLDTNLRVRFIVNAIGDPAATQYQLEAKLSTESDYWKVA